MKLKNNFYIWFRKSTRRLINSIRNTVDADPIKPQPGLKTVIAKSLHSASAEEMDFLNINEWMRSREEIPPVFNNGNQN